MSKQMAFRLYPQNYTGNSIGELNKLLSDGWSVKVTLSETEVTRHETTNTFHVFILEKDDQNG